MTGPMFVQTCKHCELKQSAFIEHTSDCFGACVQTLGEVKKVRSHEEIQQKLHEINSLHEAHKDEREYAQIEILEWVLGKEID